MTTPTVKQLSPDGFSRFFILCDIIQELYGGTKRSLKILDVGGGSEYMHQQLQATGVPYELTVLDIIDRPANLKATYVKGDATAMEFDDRSFDLVISTDVMEHIPEAGKQSFLDECLRVTSQLCVIAAPFDTTGVTEAEVVVNEFNKKLFGVGQDWLVEHLKYGKPSLDMFHKTLKRKNIAFDDFGTQNLTTWLLNTQLNLIDAKLGLPKSKHIAANRFYNENILEMNEFVGPSYRHFFIMYVNGSVKHFDTKRYMSGQTDYVKLAAYTNKLLTLTAERISELRSSEMSLSQQVYDLRQQHEADKQYTGMLEATVQSQVRVLNKFKPLLKVARIPAVRKVRSIATRKKGN